MTRFTTPLRTLAARLSSVLLLLLVGCTDDGVVGTVRGCDPACPADEICDMDAGVCMPCDDGRCSCPEPPCPGEPDECDDCDRSDTACIAQFCRSCETSSDCTREEPICFQGRCVDL